MDSGYMPVPTFDYTSAFSYRSIWNHVSDGYLDETELSSGSCRTNQQRRLEPMQQLTYYVFILLSFLFFLLTLPVSFFFCVKKVNSLQRCLTHRLGKRLPLKGPGYVLQLPFIDKTSIIDLFDDRFYIIESEDQVLTSDGSIVALRPCQGTLSVTDAVLTTLKVSDVNVKQCLRLRLGNVIRSKHVEDLENKMDYVVREFEENCNKFLLRWGYAFKMDELPRLTVVQRADPINPIKSKLSKLFNQEGSEPLTSSNQLLINLLSPQLREANEASDKTEPLKSATEVANETLLLTDQQLNQIIPMLKEYLEQYKSILSNYEYIVIQWLVQKDNDTIEKQHYFQYTEGILSSMVTVPDKVHITVKFNNQADMNHFLISKDPKYVHYKIHSL